MMKVLTLFYIINASLLILHEIESAYEKEWEILNLPGKLTGFLLMHIPILLLLFYGVLEIEKQSYFGIIMGITAGMCGIAPFLVHKILVNRKEHFNLWISNLIIYLSLLSGCGTAILSIRQLI